MKTKIVTFKKLDFELGFTNADFGIKNKNIHTACPPVVAVVGCGFNMKLE